MSLMAPRSPEEAAWQQWNYGGGARRGELMPSWGGGLRSAADWMQQAPSRQPLPYEGGVFNRQNIPAFTQRILQLRDVLGEPRATNPGGYDYDNPPRAGFNDPGGYAQLNPSGGHSAYFDPKNLYPGITPLAPGQLPEGDQHLTGGWGGLDRGTAPRMPGGPPAWIPGGTDPNRPFVPNPAFNHPGGYTQYGGALGVPTAASGIGAGVGGLLGGGHPNNPLAHFLNRGQPAPLSALGGGGQSSYGWRGR